VEVLFLDHMRDLLLIAENVQYSAGWTHFMVQTGLTS